MIRNIVAYPLPHGWQHLAHETAELLSRRTFQGCGPLDTAHAGFVPPRDDAALCEAIAGRYLFCYQHEEKLLPTSVVNEYVETKRVVLEQGRPSISLIQRHLRIGYNRAARLIEQMEADGLVSAMRADGTREVLAA